MKIWINADIRRHDVKKVLSSCRACLASLFDMENENWIRWCRWTHYWIYRLWRQKRCTSKWIGCVCRALWKGRCPRTSRQDKKETCRSEVVEVITPSTKRTAARCLFGTCGGCKCSMWNTMLSSVQAAACDRCVERIGGMKDVPILPIIVRMIFIFYRNKLEFSFSDKAWEMNKLQSIQK